MTPEERKQLRAAYKFVFDTDDGKRVLADLRRRCHAHTSTFSSNPNETYFLEGQRQVVLFIEDMLSEDDTRELPTTAIDEE